MLDGQADGRGHGRGTDDLAAGVTPVVLDQRHRVISRRVRLRGLSGVADEVHEERSRIVVSDMCFSARPVGVQKSHGRRNLCKVNTLS